MNTETEALTYDHIVALALENGFKLKPQVDGRMALNDYVIDFARAVYDIGRAAAKSETADVGEPVAFAHFAENGNIRLWAPERPRDLDGNAAHPLYTAAQLAAAVAKERERATDVLAAFIPEWDGQEAVDGGDLIRMLIGAIRAGAKEPSDADKT